MIKPSITYDQKLKALRALMAQHAVQAYIVPRADEFQGEFVAPYAERLKWLSGFTGSAGTAIVFENKALVLTDGRYLIQVAQQVDSTCFQTGEYIKKKQTEWLLENLHDGDCIGYDPYLYTLSQIEALEKECVSKNITIKPISGNLIDAVWGDQPARPIGKVTLFPDLIAGKSARDKIADIALTLKKNNAHTCVIALPDSIAWILNIRGSDVPYIPYVLSYLLVHANGSAQWLIDPKKIDNDVRVHFDGVLSFYDIHDIATPLKAMTQSDDQVTILLDPENVPIALQNMILESGGQVKPFKDPTVKPKAQKTASEIVSIRNAHIQDGVALVKFLKWIEEKALAQEPLSEMSVSEQLESYRKESPYFKENSFPTIAGFASNGAIVHYRADETTDKAIGGSGLLLLDSGGQYAGDDCFGTTDITRTIAIGTPSNEMRENFTRVLKGHIGLAMAKFPKGTIGAQIDTLARKSLWDVGLDFAHGTGHGVGCYLSVHEEAASISPRGKTAFEIGMLISNEPGYYKEGAYGIRIENLVFVNEVDAMDMLCFETISYAPIDRNLIVVEMLSSEEHAWLARYHSDVCDKLFPLLDVVHKQWLLEKTRLLDV